MCYRNSYRQALAAVLVGLWASVAVVSCAPEFTDEQCANDQDCFADEVCSAQGICVLGTGGDVGVDADADADEVEIASIVVSPEQVDVALGLTVPLDATAFDDDGNEIDDATFDWSSSDDLVATVNQDGEVTGLEIGTATITVSSVDDPSIQASASVTVVEGEVASVEIDPGSLALTVGETATLTATAFNEGNEEISDVQVTWTSDAESIATVETDGTVTAVAPGEASVTATVEGVQASVVVEVQPVPVARIEIDPTAPSVEVGSTVELTATAFDANDTELTGRQITWTSDDESIATIDSGGVVTGVAVGTATITAQVGNQTATVDVEVIPANVAPVADAGADETVAVGETVTLDGSASSDSDGDTLTYSWAFTSQPSSSTATLSDATAAQPTFTPDVAGNYTLELTVDDGSATATDTVVITASNLPVADAGADQTVTVGDTVNLDGSNSSDPDGDTLTYSWIFSSRPTGSTTTLSDASTATPSFTADVAGDYVVELTVDDGTATGTDTVTITANTPPVADAGADRTVAINGSVSLDGSNSSDPDGDTLSYSWAFTSQPSGSTTTLTGATTATPSFTPDVAGDYVVELTVDDGNATATDTVTITASNLPVADAGADQTVTVGDTVNLDGSNSSDPDGDALTFGWTLTSSPTGSTATLSNAATATPAFTADVAGDYVVELTVDDGTSTASDTVTITANTPPVADAGADQTVTVGDLVNLDGSNSSDPDNDTLTYSWTFTSQPAASTATLTDAATATPSFTADVAGDYVLELTVDDGNLTATDTVTITANTPPVADAGADQTVTVGDIVNLDGSSSSDPDGDTITYGWTLTSAPATSTATLSNAATATPSFTADVAGDYVVELTVDDGNATATDTVTITANTPPVANAGADQAVTTGTLVTLDGSSSSDPDGDAITYSWTLTSAPTGSTASLTGATTASPTFTPDLDGPYVIELTVDDGTDTTTDTVTVTAAP